MSKPCPFCGSTDICTIRGVADWAECRTCRAQGPQASGYPAAWQAWDQRSTPQPDAERLMKLAEAWVDARAELCRIATKRVPIEDNAAHYQQVRAADAKCNAAEAAFRAALSSPGSPASGGVR